MTDLTNSVVAVVENAQGVPGDVNPVNLTARDQAVAAATLAEDRAAEADAYRQASENAQIAAQAARDAAEVSRVGAAAERTGAAASRDETLTFRDQARDAAVGNAIPFETLAQLTANTTAIIATVNDDGLNNGTYGRTVPGNPATAWKRINTQTLATKAPLIQPVPQDRRTRRPFLSTIRDLPNARTLFGVVFGGPFDGLLQHRGRLRNTIADRRSAKAIVSEIQDRAGRIRFGYDLVRDLMRSPGRLIPVPITDRRTARLYFSVVRLANKQIALGINAAGELVARLSPETLAQIQAVIAPPTRLLTGTHNQVASALVRGSFLVAAVTDADGHFGEVKQRLDISSSTAIGTGVVRFRQMSGQSNTGAGSGLGPPYLTGTLEQHHIVQANGFPQAWGDDDIAAQARAATDLRPVTEANLSQAQTPASLIAYAERMFERGTGDPLPVLLTAFTWRGSMPIEAFLPENTNPQGRYIHSNNLGQAKGTAVAAAFYGEPIRRHDFIWQQGEAASTDYGTKLLDYIDRVVPMYRGSDGSGCATGEFFLTQISSGSEEAVANGSEVAQLSVARTRYGQGVVLAGPQYDCPMDDVAGSDIHYNNIGRMIWCERMALALFYRARGIPYRPLWPVAGGVTRSGAVIRIPLELPPDAKGVILRTGWQPASVASGFKFADDSGSPPTVSGVAIERVNGVWQAVVTLSAVPTGANKRIRYALDASSLVGGWSSCRGDVCATTNIPSPFARAGFAVPPTVLHPLVRFEEIVP